MGFEGLMSGAKGIQVASKDLETIGDNIANVNSISFKGSEAMKTNSFSNVLRSASVSQGGDNSGSNTSCMQIGTGSQISSIIVDFRKGAKHETGKESDLYLDGMGFFKVVDSASGRNYATRDGSFKIDDRKFLTTQGGYRLQGYINNKDAMPTYKATLVNNILTYEKVDPADVESKGVVGDIVMDYALSVTNGRLINDTNNEYSDAEISVLAPTVKSYNIDQNGNITFTMSNDHIIRSGQMLLLDFNDPQGLTKEANGLYSNFSPAGVKPYGLETSKPGTNGLAKVHSGALELSNVDLTQEFTKMIIAQRTLQASAKVITTNDEALQELLNLKR